MSLELWNTVGTLGTFLVIAATAVAALVQLRHMRRSNQIAALSELFEKANAPESIAARHYVFSKMAAKMQDPAFRYEVANRAARTQENAEAIANAVIVGSYYEEMGLLAKAGLVDRDLVCDMHGEPLIALWNALLEFTAIGRERNPELLENFEYLVVLAQDWHAKTSGGLVSAEPSSPRRTEQVARDRPAVRREPGQVAHGVTGKAGFTEEVVAFTVCIPRGRSGQGYLLCPTSMM